MDKNLPIYEMLIDENEQSDSEVNFVALVDNPAIEKNFMAFHAEDKPLAFSSIDEEKRIVFGPAMIPDMPIYRSDESGEYFVTFSRETIESIALKFFSKGYQRNVNEMHNPEQKTDDVVFFQSLIKDSARGIDVGGEAIPDGTWLLGGKVKNDAIWQKIKSGEYRGFSVEGLFKIKRQQMSAEEAFQRIATILQSVEGF